MQNSIEAIKKIIIFVILAKMMSSHRASGFISNTSRPISCQGSAATIDFDFDLQGDSIVPISKVWYFDRILIGQDTGTGFTALGNYSGRLTDHLTHGLTLNSVTTADNGTYEYEFLLAAGLTVKTATASLTVYIAPSSPPGCFVNASQSSNTVTCTVSGNCGTPPLIPFWVNSTLTISNQFECIVGGTYQCCATSAAHTSCYSGSSNDFCTLFNCAPVTTNTTTKNATQADCALKSFLGLALGVGLGTAAICIICHIVIVILVKPGKTEKLAVDIDIGKTLRQHGSDVKIICSVYGSENNSVHWTGQEENQLTNDGRYTIAPYDSNTNKSCLTISTSSMANAEGYICQVAFKKPGVTVKIYITITVLDNGSLKVSIEKTILFVPASKNERSEWIGPQKNILTNTGRYTIVPYDSKTNKSHLTIKDFSMNDNGSYTCQPQNSSVSSPENSITITTNDAANPNKSASKLILGFVFGIICVAWIVCIVILVTIGPPCEVKFAIGLGLGLGISFPGCIIVIVILVKKGCKKTSEPKNGNAKSGSRSDVSRKDVEIQLEEKGVKSNEERPLVNHNRIGNKDDSEAEQVLSKPFDPKERRPLPPLNKEVKDKPTHYSQQIPSGKNDVKDKNSRGLSANFDDTQGLASEITRPSKLPPIEFQVQSTVQEEDTSEEPKKTKKNKRKKEKIDEEKHADKTAK